MESNSPLTAKQAALQGAKSLPPSLFVAAVDLPGS